MYTTIVTNEGQEIKVVSQQYEVGLYVILNNDPANQFGVNKKEDLYHKDIRIKTLKMGGKIIGGTTLDVRSKYPINTFSQK
jgi:hypothetical protein